MICPSLRIVFATSALLVSLLLAEVTRAEESTTPPLPKTAYTGSLTINLTKLPKFEEYKVKPEALTERAKSFDLSSYIGADDSEQALRKAESDAPNFAGSYLIVSEECETVCHRHWVINLTTGKIIDRINSETGILFKANSRLLIVNPPKDWNNLNDSILATIPEISFLVLDDDNLLPLRQIKTEGLF